LATAERTTDVLVGPEAIAESLTARPPRRPTLSYGWIIVAVVALVMTATNGARFLFGVVLKPVSEQFDWDRASLGLVVTISTICLSASQPFVGVVVDRFGPKRVLAAGTLLLGTALLPFSLVSQLWQVYLIYGVVIALGIAAATSPVIATTLVSRWFAARRGAALSLATAGSAFGQLIVVPLAVWSLGLTDWRSLYRLVGLLLIVVIAPLALLLLRDRPAGAAAGDPVTGRFAHLAGTDDHGLTLGQSLRTLAFWQLAFGFVVCGFTMAFPNTHFLAYADDMGMDGHQAGLAVSITAVFSVLGSFLLSLVGDHYRRPPVLALTYALRGLAFLLLLLLPSGDLLFVYALILGVSWTATTPLTAAIAADRYGPRHLGVVFGTMFTFMNIGSGLGAFLDGLIFELAGGYRLALVASAVLGGLAALVVWSVADARRVDLASPVPPPGDLARDATLPTTAD
jgi:MFS family permease